MRVAVNLVMVDVTAKTKAGQILGDLKKEDFELREDGAAQKVEIFSRDELPLNVALVLDLSDSIELFLGPLRGAANTALGALKPEDQAALFTGLVAASKEVILEVILLVFVTFRREIGGSPAQTIGGRR